MKTILHVIDSVEAGGAETVFVQLAELMRSRGNRSIAVVNGEGWASRELRRRQIEPMIIDAGGAFNVGLVRALARVVREQRVDLIQSHLLGSNVYCALAGAIARVPVVATFHGMVDVSPNERLRWLKFMIMNVGVDRFVAVSHRLRDAIDAAGLLNPRKTTIIYNGIDFDRYRGPFSRSLRAKLGLAEGARLVGSLGNLHPAKGYDLLLAAVPGILRRAPDVHFVIAGALKEPIASELRQAAEALGVGRHVHFLGFIDDSAAFLGELDLFLLSSTSEGFSIATLEAMASGLPVVVTRCGGPEEIVRDGVTGLAVDVTAAGIESGVAHLLESPALAGELATAGQQHARSTSSLAAMADSYLRIYETLWAR